MRLGTRGKWTEMFCADNESYFSHRLHAKIWVFSKVDLNEPETWAEVHLLKSTGRDKLRRFEIFRSHDGSNPESRLRIPLFCHFPRRRHMWHCRWT